jgi:hypothetical protein
MKIRTAVALVACALAPSAASTGQDPAPDDDSVSPFASSELPPRYDVSSMTRPVLRSSPNGKKGPDYSAADRDAGIEGLVIVDCVLTTAGIAKSCKVIKPLSPLTAREAVDWLMGCRWSPVTFEGKPVAVRYVFNFNFKRPGPTLQDGGQT